MTGPNLPPRINFLFPPIGWQAEAQNNIALCFENGEGVKQDMAEAVKWFRSLPSYLLLCIWRVSLLLRYRLSAAEGNTDAQYNLGLCYRNGKGVQRDMVQAAKWYLPGCHATGSSMAPINEDLPLLRHVASAWVGMQKLQTRAMPKRRTIWRYAMCTAQFIIYYH